MARVRIDPKRTRPWQRAEGWLRWGAAGFLVVNVPYDDYAYPMWWGTVACVCVGVLLLVPWFGSMCGCLYFLIKDPSSVRWGRKAVGVLVCLTAVPWMLANPRDVQEAAVWASLAALDRYANELAPGSGTGEGRWCGVYRVSSARKFADGTVVLYLRQGMGRRMSVVRIPEVYGVHQSWEFRGRMWSARKVGGQGAPWWFVIMSPEAFEKPPVIAVDAWTPPSWPATRQ